MEKLIVIKICKGKKWYERIIRMFLRKSYVEVYKLGVEDCFNSLYKD